MSRYYVSATQASYFLDSSRCKRAWAWAYIKGFKQKPGLKMFAGDWVHNALSAWLTAGVPPSELADNLLTRMISEHATELVAKNTDPEEYTARLIAVANRALPQLPYPNAEGVRVERGFRFDLGDVTWIGFKDLEVPGLVTDFKITSSPQYAKTSEDLEHDPQATLYAAETMARTDTQSIALEWLYLIPNKTPRVKPVVTTLTREHVDSELVKLAEIGKEIHRLRVLAPDPMTIEPNIFACDSFGGCPYLSLCYPAK